MKTFRPKRIYDQVWYDSRWGNGCRVVSKTKRYDDDYDRECDRVYTYPDIEALWQIEEIVRKPALSDTEKVRAIKRALKMYDGYDAQPRTANINVTIVPSW